MRKQFPALIALATSMSISVSCAAPPGAKEQSAMSATLQDHSVAFRDPQLADIAAAVARGDAARIAALAPGVDLSAHGDQNVTLLEYAIWHEQPRALGALLDAGANPAEPGMDQETVVHMAAMAKDPHYLKLLLQHGAPVDPVSARGHWTPLFRALQSKRDEQIQLLLQAGADPHRVDASGNSLLHLAAQSSAGNPWVLKLLKAGVDPGLRNAQHKTFQAYFFATPERLLNSTAQQTRAAVRDWLSAHAIPLEATR
ncbi:ankyrin repeat domain-containing protein [Xanthomonas graminis]|uniref:ABC transporter permease n=1 Tax=Xanthomonas graminis pv. poae TaxID=227946 RepID=A0A199P3G5_9XANT|nr:ankyrin repeat domain-containing protein [Xanthomonas translucens]OAX55531.1 ABC transporter permease [Xanthomonas translucens pv. poae]